MELYKKAAAFAADVRDSLMQPQSYPERVPRGLKGAAAYFLALLLVTSVLGAAAQVAWPMASVIMGSTEMDAAFQEIPDFAIEDGKFRLMGNVTEPYYLAPNMVIDTTGALNETPIDAEGNGMLITQDAILQMEAYKEQRLYFKEMGAKISNKKEFVDFMNKVIVLTMPVAFAVISAFRFFIYGVFCSVLVGFFVGARLLSARMRGGLIRTSDNVAMAAYAQTPLLLASIISPVFGGLILTLLGIGWGAYVYYNVAKKDG
jgi:hypothetical protein